MTTTREEFEAWMHAECFQEPPSYCVDLAWAAWKAAHLAGQRAMQERAAELCEQFSLAVSDSDWSEGYAAALKDAACGIRALEVKP